MFVKIKEFCNWIHSLNINIALALQRFCNIVRGNDIKGDQILEVAEQLQHLKHSKQQ